MLNPKLKARGLEEKILQALFYFSLKEKEEFKMKSENVSTFILKSFLAGVMIGIGGLAYIATGNPWVFPIGLFVVCAYDLRLFTGKICYLEYSPEAFLMMWCFNTVGACIFGLICRVMKPGLIEKAVVVSNTKLSENWPQIAMLAVLCNLMIFLAVDFWRRRGSYDPYPLRIGDMVGFAGLIFATAVFVICGFEHCIANAFYFSFAGADVVAVWKFLIINTIFNAVGGIEARKLLRIKEISPWEPYEPHFSDKKE